MRGSVFRRNTCRLCDGHELELALHLDPTPIADDYVSVERLAMVQETYPLDLFLCRTCGHVQLLDVVDPEVLFGDYVYVTSISLGLVEHFRRYADDVLRRIIPPVGAFVVEIGSNDGTLLKFFQDRGMCALGIDPARGIARKATESGIETLPTFFTSELARKIRLERGAATIVCANNVFAHGDNLADMVEGVRELLAPDAVFVFEVSYLVDIVQKMLFDTIYHEHLCYHSVKPLDRFFRRHGMELIDIERIASKGGSLRATVQLTGGPRAMSPKIEELIALEASLGLDRVETFRAFAAKIESVKTQLLELLHDLKSQGRTIVGYGASATVTTLIYHFELSDKLSFIVDDNPTKQNSFSPGHHIPVLSPQAIYERKPEYVLILAWQYAEPIKEKHHAFLEQGGHFIVPLPRVEVI
jgi:SAM-dependent methyltransferase